MNTKNNLIKTKGIILKVENYKEFDKLLTILSNDYGKIVVYAFNVRKQNSKNLGNLCALNYLNFEIIENNDKYTFSSSTLIKSFSKLTEDYDKMCYASYFSEFVSYVTLENTYAYDKTKLLYYSYKALLDDKMSNKLVRRVFELKMLKLEGIYKTSDSLYTKNDACIYAWDFVLKTEIEKLFSFTLNDEVFKLFDSEVDIEVKKNIEHKFVTEKNLC